MWFLAIDPGLSTGWAIVDARGMLVACDGGQAWPLAGVRRAIIERPQVYRAAKSKGDPNDLITLAIRVGRYQERIETKGVPCDLVLPTTWKGQVPKNIHHVRVEGTLSNEERAIVATRYGRAEAKDRNEDVWDAVALAKWAFGAGRFAINRNVT